MKSQVLESLFVLGCSVFGLACGTPVADLVQAAVRNSTQAITRSLEFAPRVQLLKLGLAETLASIWCE
jgi:hypothetical protein